MTFTSGELSAVLGGIIGWSIGHGRWGEALLVLGFAVIVLTVSVALRIRAER